MIKIKIELIGPSKIYDAMVSAKVVLNDMSMYVTVNDSVKAVNSTKNSIIVKLIA